MTAQIETLLAVGGTAFYALAAALVLASLAKTAEGRERAAVGLLVPGALLVLATLAARVVRAGGVPSLTLFDALAGYALALSGAYMLLTLYRRTRGIAILLIPYATLALICGIPALQMEPGPPPPVQGPWLVCHVLTAYAAYGVFTLAGLNAAAYLVQDSNLKHKRFGAVWARLPSLEALDHVMSRMAGAAFLLFTVSIVLGFSLVHRSGGGDEWFTDPKVAATVATWILFAVFVHMRASSDRHGRGIALIAVAGLVCLLFTFVGVHWFAGTVHDFLRIGAGEGGP
jgi:ABC-type transport system involved in cytochrome c biogenesis permease subunit